MSVLSKKEKKWAAVIAVTFNVLAIYMLLMLLGVIQFGALLYTVDDQETIYIVENIDRVRIIPVKGDASSFRLYSAGSYASLKVADNKIVFEYDTGGKLVTDLQGHVITKDFSEKSALIRPSQRLEDPVVSPNGKVYQFVSFLGFYRIDEIREAGRPVIRYSMPAIEVFSRIILFLTVLYTVFLGAFIPLYFIKNKRIQNGKIVPPLGTQGDG